MSTTGATSTTDSTAQSAIKAGDIKQALAAIEKLQATDDINAVSAQLIIFPNMQLWVAFLSNQAIEPKISEKHLREMYSTLTTQYEAPTCSPLVKVALKRVNVIKAKLFERAGSDEKQFMKACQWQDIDAQVGIIGRINEAPAHSKIFTLVLKSTNVALWQSFIGNRSVTTRLTKAQCGELIEHLQKFAKDPQDLRVWTELLAIYAIKLFPANYIEKLSFDDAAQHSQRFALLLDIAITKINLCVAQQDNIETIRWLQFILKLAEHPETLVLLRANDNFKDKPPFDLAILSSAMIVQLLKVFPIYLSVVLTNVYRSVEKHALQKSHREYREAVSLIRLLNNEPTFGIVVKADPNCRELLGVSQITDIAPPLKPPAAPAIAISQDDENEMTEVELGEDSPLLPGRNGPPPSLLGQPNIDEVGCLDRLFAPCLALFRSLNKRSAEPVNHSQAADDPMTLYSTMR